MVYGYLADAVVILHLGYIVFCILATLLILLGILLRWQWIRNPIFRWTHALMIIVVAFEASIGFECPLTTWEYDLRQMEKQVKQTQYTGVVAGTVGLGNPLACAPLSATTSLSLGNEIKRPRPYASIGQFAADTLFVDWPVRTLLIAYCSFAGLVLLCFIIAPPRWRKKDAAVREPARLAS